MISTVLYEKHGVITEDRFQKMTPMQWIFHYKEIMKHKNEEAEHEHILYERLIKTMEFAGTFSHPSVDVATILSALKSDGKSAEESAEEAITFIKENEHIFPETISVNLAKKTTSNIPQGHIDRELGIIIND